MLHPEWVNLVDESCLMIQSPTKSDERPRAVRFRDRSQRRAQFIVHRKSADFLKSHERMRAKIIFARTTFKIARLKRAIAKTKNSGIPETNSSTSAQLLQYKYDYQKNLERLIWDFTTYQKTTGHINLNNLSRFFWRRVFEMQKSKCSQHKPTNAHKTFMKLFETVSKGLMKA